MFDINFISSGAELPEGFWSKVLPTLFCSLITTGLSLAVTIYIFTRNNSRDVKKAKKEEDSLKMLINISIEKTAPVLEMQINQIKDTIDRLANDEQNDFTVTILLFGLVEPVRKLPAEKIFEVFSSSLSEETVAEKYDDYMSCIYGIQPIINQLMQENQDFSEIMRAKNERFNLSATGIFDIGRSILMDLGQEAYKDPVLKRFFQIIHTANQDNSSSLKFLHEEIIKPILALFVEFPHKHYHKDEIIKLAQNVDFQVRDINACKAKYSAIFSNHIPILQVIQEQLKSIKLP